MQYPIISEMPNCEQSQTIGTLSEENAVLRNKVFVLQRTNEELKKKLKQTEMCLIERRKMTRRLNVMLVRKADENKKLQVKKLTQLKTVLVAELFCGMAIGFAMLLILEYFIRGL